MKVDSFGVGPCPTEAGTDGYLFVSPAFNVWQAEVQGKRLQSFGLFRKDTRQVYARLTLAGQGRAWAVPVTGAFGGPVIDKNVPVGALDALVQEAMRWLKEEADAESCFFRLPPASFPDPAAALMQNVLFRNGWSLDQIDVNYHCAVVSGEAFYAQLGDTSRRETRRLRETGAGFCLIPPEQVGRAYDVIARNHAARGYPMTMTREAVLALATAFPSHVHFFGVMRGDDLLASAICLKCTSAYFYIFNLGEDPQFRKEMPVRLLLNGLVDHCHRERFVILDYGVATDKSQPNEGLIAFKNGLGFRPSPKLTFRYDFG